MWTFINPKPNNWDEETKEYKTNWDNLSFKKIINKLFKTLFKIQS